MTCRQSDLLPGSLPELYKSGRKAKKLLAGRSEGRSSFISDEKWAS